MGRGPTALQRCQTSGKCPVSPAFCWTRESPGTPACLPVRMQVLCLCRCKTTPALVLLSLALRPGSRSAPLSFFHCLFCSLSYGFMPLGTVRCHCFLFGFQEGEVVRVCAHLCLTRGQSERLCLWTSDGSPAAVFYCP